MSKLPTRRTFVTAGLKTARARRIPSGVEISVPGRNNIRLRLPKDCTGVQFLAAVYRNSRVDLNVRIECAIAAAPYQSPRLVAIVSNNVDQATRRIIVEGGLPRLPGTQTLFPPGMAPDDMPAPAIDSSGGAV
jgi:hypothetical protein